MGALVWNEHEGTSPLTRGKESITTFSSSLSSCALFSFFATPRVGGGRVLEGEETGLKHDLRFQASLKFVYTDKGPCYKKS